MINLKALKVKIGLNADGTAQYPNFEKLDVIQSSPMAWTKYVDVQGMGWLYDKTSGHKDETANSPRGQQWGMLLVPAEFADQAVAMYPNECTSLTEVEAQSFFEEKAKVNEPHIKADDSVVNALRAKKEAGLTLTQEDLDALDPDKPNPGVVKNQEKKWSDYKVAKNINIV